MENTSIYTKMMFGENAIHIPARIILQNQGEAAMLVAVVPNIMSETAKSKGLQHELIDCEIIIRPKKRAATNAFKGLGIAGIITTLECWEIDNYETETLHIE